VREFFSVRLRNRAVALYGALFCVALAAVALTIGLTSAPVTAALPNDKVHMGVASCAGSTCHGRQEADGRIVRQDEIMRWQEASTPGGAHSRALAVLSEPRGREIGRRLNLNPTSDEKCIGCHADAPPAALRGAQFRLSDGVGCEACHGGSQGWLVSHRGAGLTGKAPAETLAQERARHQDNLNRGMIALERPATKASVCLDCHFGSADGGQFVTHEIMAAGHPRISFELDLFSTLQQHHNEDNDYARRKGAKTNNVRVWAIGQAMALDRALTLYANPRFGQAGAFPEFYFFDCHSCHRQIKDSQTFSPTAIDNPGRGTPPGAVPFNDENMIMLSAAARIAAPGLAARFDADSRAFHRANGEGRAAALAGAAKLRASAQALIEAFGRMNFSRAETIAIIDTIASAEIAKRYTDYSGSTQSVMAVDTLLNAMVSAGQVSGAAATSIRADVNRAYAAVRDPNDYRPLDFRRALGGAVRTIRTLR